MSKNKIESVPVFADRKLDDEFDKYGYVVVKLLHKEEVKLLTDFYLANPNPFKAPFHTTHFADNKEYKGKVHEVITKTIAPKVKLVLPNYMPAFGNYMIKEPGGNNPMPLHADWTYVDENQANSIALWAPLVDSTPENGQLGVIPFSQFLSHPIRGPRILQWEHPFNEILIKAMGKLLQVKAGEVVIYNHRLLHFSPANNSKYIRPAINLSFVPRGIQILHYTVPDGRVGIHRYEIENPDFFIHYDNFQVPEKGNLTGIDLAPVPMINEQIHTFIHEYAPKDFMQRLKNMFL